MKKNFILLFLIFSYPAMANDSTYAKHLPSFSLKDPADKVYTDKDFLGKGLVLVVTAPILSAESAQRGWSKFLPATKGTSKARLVFLEDMQPSYFKGTALKSMKKDYEPGKEPILLVDHEGELRKNLNAPEAKTIILVYNKNLDFVYAISAKPSESEAKIIWEKAQ